MNVGSLLGQAAQTGRLEALVGESSPLRPVLAAAAHRFLRPLHVQVTGRPGVGRDTMARALAERLGLTATGPAADGLGRTDADLWVHVLVGRPRRADHAILADLPTDRVLMVLGKADIFADPQDADAAADGLAHLLRQPVYPVSGLFACADVAEDEFALLCTLAENGEHMPSSAGRFLAGAPGSAERAARAGLLRRIDQRGVDTALTWLGGGRGGPPAGSDMAMPTRATLNAVLREMSGIDALRAPIRDRVDRVRWWREVELRAVIERAAADGCDRDAAEWLLREPGPVRPAAGGRR